MFAFLVSLGGSESALSSVPAYKYAKTWQWIREITIGDYYEFIADTDGVARHCIISSGKQSLWP